MFVVDLEIGSGASPLTSYVAITRVRRREDILIFRPFAREIFARGSPEGPQLLLQRLQGEDIEFPCRAQAKARGRPRQHTDCSVCRKSSPEVSFNSCQRQRPQDLRRCNSCVNAVGWPGAASQCSACGKTAPEVSFNASQARKSHAQRKCNNCIQRKFANKRRKA